MAVFWRKEQRIHHGFTRIEYRQIDVSEGILLYGDSGNLDGHDEHDYQGPHRKQTADSGMGWVGKSLGRPLTVAPDKSLGSWTLQ
jgi:hypothetical protein